MFSSGKRQEPVSFHEYVHAPYPVGLGIKNEAILVDFISDTPGILDAFEQAKSGGVLRGSWLFR